MVAAAAYLVFVAGTLAPLFAHGSPLLLMVGATAIVWVLSLVGFQQISTGNPRCSPFTFDFV